MENIVICSAVRTAVGAYLGSLKTVPPEILGARVIEEAVRRAGIEKETIDLAVMGHVMVDGEARNIARVSALLAGLAEKVPAYSVDLQCGSGLQAVRNAVMELQLGEATVAVAGGTESMSRGVFYLPPQYRYEGFRSGNFQVYDSFFRGAERVQPPALYPELNMGLTAENIAERYCISREEQDAFAYDSQKKAAIATEQGLFREEILPIEVKTRKETFLFDQDEHPKPDTALETLAAMKPVFRKGGTVTAGNASGMNDGASAVVLATQSSACALGMHPLARILSHHVVGLDPCVMGLGPVEAIWAVLSKAGLTLEQMDLIEINEAFAAQSLGVLKELGLYPGSVGYEKVNVNGGAIAHGHALANSGTRLLTTLLYELRRRKGRYGIVALCIGGGQGIAMLVERIEPFE